MDKNVDNAGLLWPKMTKAQHKISHWNPHNVILFWPRDDHNARIYQTSTAGGPLFLFLKTEVKQSQIDGASSKWIGQNNCFLQANVIIIGNVEDGHTAVCGLYWSLV